MITGKILKINGWPEGKVIGMAKAAAATLENEGLERDAVLSRLDAVRVEPSEFIADPLMGDLARELLRRQTVDVSRIDDKLHDEPIAFQTWGAEGIDSGAVDQMNHAMRLPISVAGALMPDAHVGYGLPIGGVLATEDAVIPYAVGVDIACRMRLSLYEVSPQVLGSTKRSLKRLAEPDQVRRRCQVERSRAFGARSSG
jgi:tRNA-splicing ligase RtcB